MSDTSSGYWLPVIRREPRRTVLEAEDGYKNCRRPGRPFRVVIGPDGPACPGCFRVCSIPASAALGRDDEIIMQKHEKTKRNSER